jgi:hypothetical protein
MTGAAKWGRPVSVLRNRILAQGSDGPQYTHPGGTSATPMVMPLALVNYGGAGATYEDLHAQPATGDVNAVPLAVVAPGTFGKVVPAGRP